MLLRSGNLTNVSEYLKPTQDLGISLGMLTESMPESSQLDREAAPLMQVA